MIRPHLIYFHALFFFFLGAFAGCSEKASPRVTLSEAQEKFLKICRTKDHLDVHLLLADNALWIYLPLNEDFFKYTGQPGPRREAEKKEHLIPYLKGSLKKGEFSFRYDIVKADKLDKDPGYKSEMPESVLRKRLQLLAALQEAFFELNELPGDRDFASEAQDIQRDRMLEAHVKKEKVPEFFVILMADINNGLAYKTVFLLEDYKRLQAGSLPYEEYSLREINEFYGDSAFIGNNAGRDLNTAAIAWPWFLVEQVKNRITFKFQKSDFPPTGETEETVMTAIAQTTGAYAFGDFTSVYLEDLRAGKKFKFSKEQLATFAQ